MFLKSYSFYVSSFIQGAINTFEEKCYNIYIERDIYRKIGTHLVQTFIGKTTYKFISKYSKLLSVLLPNLIMTFLTSVAIKHRATIIG